MKTLLFITFFSIALFSSNSYSQDGASIFKKNCGICHTVGKGKLVGPDLKGADKKYDIKWLTQWIKSSQTMVKKKDTKAVQIFNDNNHMVMPDQTLSDDEINMVLAFVGDETTKLEQPVVTTQPEPTSVKTSASFQSTSDNSTGITSKAVIYILFAIIIFLILIIIGLGNVIKDILETYGK